ncbi:hypothetical protein ACLB2K_026528 [Fragaria x ananassa]
MRKKAKSASKDAMEDDDDYDFKVDYVKKGSAMDVTDGTGRNDEGQITGKITKDEPGKAKEKTTTKTSRQNEKLYAIDGMLNTKKKKAEKKMRKKAKSASKDAMEDDDDYDFKVDYVKKGSAMDVTDGTGRNDEGQITGKITKDEPGKAKEKTTTKTSRQNEKLYAIDGMLNTKKKKAEKKMRKKAKSASKDAMEDDDDYDFKVDYVKKGSAMDVTDGTGRNDEGQITGKVPMSGIGFDEPEEE